MAAVGHVLDRSYVTVLQTILRHMKVKQQTSRSLHCPLAVVDRVCKSKPVAPHGVQVALNRTLDTPKHLNGPRLDRN